MCAPPRGSIIVAFVCRLEINVDLLLLLKAAIMGVVEGLTEFLPISSTGHLILAGALLGFDDEKAKVFDIAIQTGAIFAVILVYWQRIKSTILELPTQRKAQKFALNVIIGFLPAVVLALIFSSLFSWTPGLKTVSPGLSIVVCTVAAAAICAALFPVKEEREAA